MESGAESQGSEVRFAPGESAPTAVDKYAHLRTPEHKAKLAANRDAWNSLPKSERARRREATRAENQAKAAAKQARRAEKEARRASKSRSSQDQAPEPESRSPDTVRSARMPNVTIPSPPLPASVAAPAPAPSLEVPRRGASDVRGLLDLVGMLPELGTGTCFIQVTRIKPTTAFGQNCAGVQKPIWEPIDDADFLSEYGGAEYHLRGYSYLEDGRPKAMTEIVTYKVAGPPNLDSLPNNEEEEMQPNRTARPANGAPVRRFPVNPQAASAEAEMFDRDLTHQETMDDRRERRRQEAERNEREEQNQRRKLELERVRLEQEAKEREADRLKEVYDRQLEMARGGISEVAELMKVMRPGEETSALMRQHAQEIRAIAEGHKNEMTRLVDAQRDEIARLTQQHAETVRRLEERNAADRDRSDVAIREAERRSNDIARDVQATADRRVADAQNTARAQYEDLKSRGEERLRDQNEQWQRRYDDLKESHAREIRQKDSEINMMRSNLESNQQVILAAKDAEIKRLTQDVRVAKDEAERNKDWHGKIKEFEEQAEALGFTKGGEGGEDEGGDTKSMLIKAGMQALTQLPQMIQAGANAVAQIRQPANPPMRGVDAPRQMRANGGMRTIPQRHAPQLQAPLTFATEGGADYTPPPGTAPPLQPEMPPMHFGDPLPAPPVIVQPQATQPPPYFTPEPVPQLQAAAAVQGASQSPPAEAVPQPTSIAPPPPSATEGPADLDPQAAAILPSLCEMLTLNFDQKVPPEAVAEALSKEYGVGMLREALGKITAAQFQSFVGTNSATFPALASRNGSKYITALLKKVEQIVAGAE